MVLLCFLFPLLSFGKEYENVWDNSPEYNSLFPTFHTEYELLLVWDTNLLKEVKVHCPETFGWRAYRAVKLFCGIRTDESELHKNPKNDMVPQPRQENVVRDNNNSMEGKDAISNHPEKEHMVVKTMVYYIIAGGLIFWSVTFLLLIMLNRREHLHHLEIIREQRRIIKEKEEEHEALKKKLNLAFKEVVTLAKKNSPSFLARFQEVYPEVCEKLLEVNPKLVNTELSFCAMIWLNFSSKEIARYTFIQPKTVQIKKYRLRKKLKIPRDEDIYIWIKNL